MTDFKLPLLLFTLVVVSLTGCAGKSGSDQASPAPSSPAAVNHPSDWRRALSQVSVPVIVYHHVTDRHPPPSRDAYTVSTADFRGQMRYLRENRFNPISLAELTAFLERGKPLPPKPIVIAFDDGYTSTLTVAAPLLKQMGFGKVAIFVYTSFVDSGYKGTIRWKELERLEREYGFDVQCHTFTHPYMVWKEKDRATGKLETEEAYVRRIYETQLVYPKKRIEQVLHHPVTHLAWPFGLYNQKVMDLAKKAGFRYLYTINASPNDIYTRPDTVRRQLVTNGLGVRGFAAILQQKSLLAAALTPADGAMVHQPALISLKLLQPASLDAASLQAQVDGVLVRAKLDRAAGTLTFAPGRPMKKDRFHEVQVWGMGKEDRAVYKLGWAFYTN